MQTRREFIKTSLLTTGGLMLGGFGLDAKANARSIGANDRVRVGIIGFSDRCRSSLIPTFMASAKELGFEIVAVSDIWNRRREEARVFFKEKYDIDVKLFRNNEELYESGMCDAVIISTADFQHATHLIEAVEAGCDAYCEKPFAETMEDARTALSKALASNRIIQIGRIVLQCFHARRQYRAHLADGVPPVIVVTFAQDLFPRQPADLVQICPRCLQLHCPADISGNQHRIFSCYQLLPVLPDA